MAVKYGGPALKDGKKNLDNLAKKGKKTACGCPKKKDLGRRESPEQHLTKVEKEKLKNDIASQKSISRKRHKEKQREEQERRKEERRKKEPEPFDIKRNSKREFIYSWEGKNRLRTDNQMGAGGQKILQGMEVRLIKYLRRNVMALNGLMMQTKMGTKSKVNIKEKKEGLFHLKKEKFRGGR